MGAYAMYCGCFRCQIQQVVLRSLFVEMAGRVRKQYVSWPSRAENSRYRRIDRQPSHCRPFEGSGSARQSLIEHMLAYRLSWLIQRMLTLKHLELVHVFVQYLRPHAFHRFDSLQKQNSCGGIFRIVQTEMNVAVNNLPFSTQEFFVYPIHAAAPHSEQLLKPQQVKRKVCVTGNRIALGF